MSPRKRKRFSFGFALNPQTQRGIATVFGFAVALFFLLALFDLAGAFGMATDQALSHVFGWDKIVVPFFVLAVAIYLMSPDRLPLKLTNFVGFLLFFVGLNPLVHLLTFGGNEVTGAAIDGAAGKIGLMLATPFIPIFGFAGACIFFAAVFGVATVLIFNTSLGAIVNAILKGLDLLKTGVLFALKPFAWFYASMKARSAQRRLALEQAALQPAVQPDRSAIEDDGDDSVDEEVNRIVLKKTERSSADAVAETVVPKPRKRVPRIDIPFELLAKHDQKPTSGDIAARQIMIQRTLETFGIPVEMGEVSVGPSVTQFTFKPADGIKLTRITALHNDLALALAAHPIRIEAPIPGKSLVGVEVPNQSVAIVGLREMFETRDWRERKNTLNFALGRDVSGKPWMGDITRMPHLLVAGATGSGKSVCLNTIIMSLLYSNSPDDLKLILVDPKRVEFPIYNGVPHLITPVITDVDKTVNALKWAIREMNRRFDLLSKMQARDIASYNQRCQEKLPYTVIVVDELADLMVTAKQDVESQIVRLAQMSRAVGIHLIVATQRPSVDVITGLIKANIPARIAFSVASLMDSRTILDQSGAEKLIGRGDMLYSTAEMSTPRRIQGVFIADDEIGRVVEYIKSKYGPGEYDPTVIEKSGTPTALSSDGGMVDEDSDPLIASAKEEIIRAGKASASLLQRRLKVGYARAARLLDLLETEGFIGPGDGAKPREILRVEFSKGMDQVPVARPIEPSQQAILDQVDREIPDIEEE